MFSMQLFDRYLILCLRELTLFLVVMGRFLKFYVYFLLFPMRAHHCAVTGDYDIF